MDTHKKKVLAVPPSTNDKANWVDLKATEIFIKTCFDQITKGERVGTCFTKKGWKCIVSQFNALTGRNYDKNKLNNRYDNLRKEWRVWYTLFGKVTGLGWNSEKNTVDAPDEWWENKVLENSLYGKFRDKGLPFANELTTLFKDVVANGEFVWAPSSGVLPPNVHLGNDDDVYRPCLKNLGLDVEEGSGDSEDASVGATTEFGNINLNTSQGAASQCLTYVLPVVALLLQGCTLFKMNGWNEHLEQNTQDDDDDAIFEEASLLAALVAGWEGTAHDARVFDQALTNIDLNFPHPPPGKYYLVDSGYLTPVGYIGPYRCERYHLPEFRRSSGFDNHNEVFNYYHSSLRCTIERTFGVWKNRFAILRRMPKFKYETQVQIVVATMTIHNFIRRIAEVDADFNLYEDENTIIHDDENHRSNNLDPSQIFNVASSSEMDHARDLIHNQIIESRLNN
ncbi:hypothetical protein TSUD_328870 [Trifolium subterraneum]|uniref:Myb/SANT-like domain-containing protein n=1 Tax=Trifolium subterraneum TaxID=3900 RepID=A0A2Z6M8L4_TRISU|nr:hypothetical protein TSUD_328870 [Trifolium subterraneum]